MKTNITHHLMHSIVFIFAALALVAFIFAISFFSMTEQRILKDPQVRVVTDDLIDTKFFIGKMKQCPGDVDCYVQSDFDAAHWQVIKLPKFDVRTAAQYRPENPESRMYYRIELKIPDLFVNAPFVVSFSPKYILLDTYTVFLNGQEIVAGHGRSLGGAFVNIAIPQSMRKKGKVVIAVRGKYTASDLGINHYGKMYIGSKIVLDQLILHRERAVVTSYLLWLLTMGTIFVLFALLFLFTREKSAYGNVVVYTFCFLLEQLMRSDFLAEIMPTNFRLVLLCIGQVTGSMAILRFFLLFFFQAYQERTLFWSWSTLVILEVILCGIYSLGSQVGIDLPFVTIPFILRISELLFLSVITYACGLGTTKFYSKRRQEKRKVVKRTFGFNWSIGFLYIYLILVLWLFVNPNAYFQAILGLLICLFIATNSIRKFGYHEEQLEKQASIIQSQARDAAIGQTVTMLAHDVRKPFAQIKLILDAFDLYRGNPSLLLGARQSIDRSLQSVNAMVNDVMDFATNTIIDTAPASFVRLLDLVVRQIGCLQRDIVINFHYELTAQKMPLLDEERMMRGLGNILSNAIEALTLMADRPAGNVYFRSKDLVLDGVALVEVQVENDGPAIQEEKLEAIFEAFYTSGKKKGTGLGLAIVRKIVQLHKGQIYVNNLASGRGVVFGIQLPASDRDEVLTQSLPADNRAGFVSEHRPGMGGDSSHVPAADFCLFICDDAEVTRRYFQVMVAKLIKDLGASVSISIQTFARGEDLIAALQGTSPDMVFTDLDLQDSGGQMDGVEVVRQVKGVCPNCMIYVFTNSDPDDVRREVESVGAEQVFSLPIQPQQLKDILENFLTNSG